VAADAADERIDAVRAASLAAGDTVALHQIAGTVDYDELLDVVLEAQPDTALIAGGRLGDSFLAAAAAVVWKFDSSCQVVVHGGPCSVDGVVAVDGVEPAAVLTALRGETMPAGPVPAGAEGPSPPVTAAPALVASVGWAVVGIDLLSPAAVAQARAAVALGERAGLAFTDRDGYRHWVAVARDAPAVLALLEDVELAVLVAAAIGSPDIWLGDLEALGAPQGTSAGWRHDDAEAVAATAGSLFRPSLSVFLPIDDWELRVEVQSGSHRRRGAGVGSARAGSHDEMSLRQGEALFVTSGCRHRLLGGRALRLRFIRGWMKPSVLLIEALGERAAALGPQGRRWCGADVGLPTSVAEFLAVEEAAVGGGLSQRKGSGI
jgi:hypothetical protein